jgi:hypothetical protein
VLWSNLRSYEIIPPEMTDEELAGQLETEAPVLPAVTPQFASQQTGLAFMPRQMIDVGNIR